MNKRLVIFMNKRLVFKYFSKLIPVEKSYKTSYIYKRVLRPTGSHKIAVAKA